MQGSPEPPPPFRAERVFAPLAFKQPVTLTGAPGTRRMFVAEQMGMIYSFDPAESPPKPELFLDGQELTRRLAKADNEKLAVDGLFGLTFHPNFAKNGLVFVCYVVRWEDSNSRGQHPRGSRVVRLHVSGDPPRVDPASEELLLTFMQGGHNGGSLKFGPDGCLYISTGDGGNAFPPDGHKTGQRIDDLLSSILRIDVDHPSKDADGRERTYTIPADNPFAKTPGARGEVWAYGTRNPWKISFDRATGDLWVGDVGWELWELVYRVRKGDNYGWSVVEGRQPVNSEWDRGPTPIVPPTIEVPHTDGASITGGFVYRGKKFPELVGQYIFGDWETRRIWGAKIEGDKILPYRDICEPTVRVIDFAEDAEGEVYLLDYNAGTIHTFVRNEIGGDRPRFPTRLTETGLYDSLAPLHAAAGVLPFAINVEQWADQAAAERVVGLPGQTSIDLLPRPKQVPGSMFSRSMVWPKGAVLAKTLSLDLKAGDVATRRKIETQMLHYDGREWRGYTYEWNDAQTDATLVPAAGKERTIVVEDPAAPGGRREQAWRFFARAECTRCHNPWAEYALAFNIPQLNRDFDFSAVGGSGRDNQIHTYRHLGIVRDVVESDQPENAVIKAERPRLERDLPRYVPSDDAQADLGQRARAYLHVNCGHCHRSGGGGSAYLRIDYDTDLRDTKTVGVHPAQGGFGIADAKLIAPGDPFRSTLYLRMAKSGPGHMPYLGGRLIDTRGLALVHDWIRQLPPRLDETQLVERLAGLDEQAALKREAARAERDRWNLAREIARDRKRPMPNESDEAEAKQRYERDAAKRVESRAKDRTQLVKEVLSTPSRALITVRAIDRGELPESIRGMVVAAAAGHSDPVIRDLFERFVPESQRTKRLGESIDVAALLQRPGDAERGRKLFHESAALACKTCHKVGNQGGEIGPDLSQIAKKLDRPKLLASILDPSKEIDPQWLTYLAETTDGRLITGLLVRRDEREIILKDAQGKQHALKPTDIERLAPQPKSLMPELLLRDLTAEQAADLLAYLQTLK